MDVGNNVNIYAIRIAWKKLYLALLAKVIFVEGIPFIINFMLLDLLKIIEIAFELG